MHFRFKPRPFSFPPIVGLYNRCPKLVTLYQNETTLNYVNMCHDFSLSLLQMAHFAAKCATVSIMFSLGVDWYTWLKFHCRIFILYRFPQNAAWMTFLPMSLQLLLKRWWWWKIFCVKRKTDNKIYFIAGNQRQAVKERKKCHELGTYLLCLHSNRVQSRNEFQTGHPR